MAGIIFLLCSITANLHPAVAVPGIAAIVVV